MCPQLFERAVKRQGNGQLGGGGKGLPKKPSAIIGGKKSNKETPFQKKIRKDGWILHQITCFLTEEILKRTRKVLRGKFLSIVKRGAEDGQLTGKTRGRREVDVLS